MTKCSKRGKGLGKAKTCPECGASPSRSLLDKGVAKTAHVTGRVIEKSVDVTETVVRETKPAFKKAVDLGKKGVAKAKDKTREVAKDLQGK